MFFIIQFVGSLVWGVVGGLMGPHRVSGGAIRRTCGDAIQTQKGVVMTAETVIRGQGVVVDEVRRFRAYRIGEAKRRPWGVLGMCLLACVFVCGVQAATIHWTVFDITDDIGNVSTNGTLLDARNGGLVSRTVTGVTFESVENSGNLFDSLFGNDNIGARGWGNVVTDTDYREFLRIGQRSGRTSGGIIQAPEVWTTVHFEGLTVGNTYQIQIWASDNVSTPPQNRALVLGDGVSTGSPEFGTDAQLFFHVNQGGAGQYAIGVFVADAATQSFNVRTRNNILVGTPNWGNQDHFSNGWQIRDMGLDTSPPSPDPMTWAVEPTAVNEGVVTMTATTATDQTGVEYQFRRYAADGTTLLFASPWQGDTVFVDSGLTPDTTYGYTVTARDKTPDQFTGSPSAVAFVTMPPPDTTPPTPDPMTWEVEPTALRYDTVTMTATTATDVSGVEYYFAELSGNPGGSSSGWQDSPVFIATGLTPNTTYSYTVTARDKSLAQNETAPSAVVHVTTQQKGSATITWEVFDITDDVGNVSTEGTLVDARTGRLGVGNNVTVNGVTFKSVENSGNLFDTVAHNDHLGARGWGNVVTDGNYREFLQYGQRSGRTAVVSDPGPPPHVWTTVEILNLTVGHAYLVQIWSSDNAAGSSLERGLVLGNGEANVSPDYETDAIVLLKLADGGAGQYATGMFVANAPNQAFNARIANNLLTTPSWNNDGHYASGWQIRDLGPLVPAGTILSIR